VNPLALFLNMTAVATQIPLDLEYRPAMGREDFMVAPSNQDAVNWIDRWPEWPAPALILYGPVASGKSHLAAVWGNRADALFVDTSSLPALNVSDLLSETKNIVIDNVDLWLGDRGAETNLFHIYNILKERGHSMLLSMNVAPSHIDFSLPDLASRLRAAPAAAIQPPDDTLLSAILVKLWSDRQIKVGGEVLNYLLPRMERSFSAAYEIVQAADKLALSEKKPISIPLIRRVLLSR
jgi:DnaA regulatory inactivator Hda